MPTGWWNLLLMGYVGPLRKRAWIGKKALAWEGKGPMDGPGLPETIFRARTRESREEATTSSDAGHSGLR